MAFVLAVIGLLVGGGLFAIGPVLDQTHKNQTITNLDQIENALVLFAIRNNRLPCPADGSQTSGIGTYGQEVTQSAVGSTTDACVVTAINSVIPWRSLGLDEVYSLDGWGNRIAYFPANVFSPAQFTGVDTLVDSATGFTPGTSCFNNASCTTCLARTTGNTAPTTQSSTSSTRETICDPTANSSTPGLTPSYPYGNYLAVYVAANPYGAELTTPQPGNGASAITTPQLAAQAGGRAAYVLISHGKSGWYGWNRSGRQIQPPGPGYTIKTYNAAGTAGPAGGLGFVQGTPIGGWPPNGYGNYFDDIVRWRSPAMIIQLCGSGACGNP